eukprot:jgi/Psemu1/54056/gm1.54056_g
MIADFFTKPLQGALFYKFRDAVLGTQAEDFDEYRAKYYEALEKSTLDFCLDRYGAIDNRLEAQFRSYEKQAAISNSEQQWQQTTRATRATMHEPGMEHNESKLVLEDDEDINGLFKSKYYEVMEGCGAYFYECKSYFLEDTRGELGAGPAAVIASSSARQEQQQQQQQY